MNYGSRCPPSRSPRQEAIGLYARRLSMTMPSSIGGALSIRALRRREEHQNLQVLLYGVKAVLLPGSDEHDRTRRDHTVPVANPHPTAPPHDVVDLILGMGLLWIALPG